MANQKEKKTTDLSFLLKPTVGVKTGLEIESFGKEENKILESKLKEHLDSKVNKIRDEIVKKLPDKKEAVKKIFDKIPALSLKDIADKLYCSPLRSKVQIRRRSPTIALQKGGANEIPQIVSKGKDANCA